MFIETRGNDGVMPKEVSFSEAILSPSASFGGLYAPKELPLIDSGFFNRHMESSYKELALDLLKLFKIDIEDTVLMEALKLYDKFDEPSNPVPVSKVGDDMFVTELYHGPTRAFKDMALQPFGYILSHLAKQKNEEYLILAATSGDTGPATLESFKNKPNIKVACLYPDGGTSDVQRLQMVTEDGSNLKVIGIHGDFDDAQSALKNLLKSSEFKEELKKDGIKLSAANSVNFGRIIFQTIYHFFGYINLLKNDEISQDEKIYVIIPSGNFGNALGAYYAKNMGLPIEKILIASNENNILTDLITKGEYNLNSKKLLKTISPAMDILKSSNVERVLFDKFGSARTNELMSELENSGQYRLTKYELELLREDFDATFSDDEFGLKTIKQYIDEYNYLLDPHTATCIKAYNELREKSLMTIICSTAEWTKFSPTIINAINKSDKSYADIEALKEISEKLNIEIPNCINSLFSKPIVHDKVIDKKDITDEILKFLKG